MSIAEKLREAAATKQPCNYVDHIALALTDVPARCNGCCSECIERWYGRLANAIEAEQAHAVSKALIAEIVKPETISVGLLRGVAIDLEDMARLLSGAHAEDLSHCAGLIRKAIDKPEVSTSKPAQLPEGIEWPRFEDGELVRFGDVAKVREDIGDVIEIRFHTGKCSEVTIAFEDESTATHYMVVDGPHLKRPEPEVLDADGVPIRVGDTVYALYEYEGEPLTVLRIDGDQARVGFKEREGNLGSWLKDGNHLTHRNPDTQEAIDEDCWLDAKDYCEKHNVKTEWPKHYGKAKCEHLLARQRKLLGGE